jgi:hypothetical protein
VPALRAFGKFVERLGDSRDLTVGAIAFRALRASREKSYDATPLPLRGGRNANAGGGSGGFQARRADKK